jgi:transcriptional regulator with XRE-family HTH domain
MRRHGFTQVVLARKAGISQRTISNLLNPESHSPTLESVDAAAAAFGLEGWHLIMPGLLDDLENSGRIAALVEAYVQSSPDGRDLIQKVAEREADRKLK